MNNSVIAPYALLPGGWTRDVRIDIDADGTIARITSASPHDGATLLHGPVIPGMPNVHSHAFQRAFAGRAERRSGAQDSFWTWRQAMYALANRISPDDLEAIATRLYLEMLEAGYTSVGEFHYVHHDRGGAPFAIRSEMSQRLLAAAQTAGIGVTLLPVFYRWSGFANAPPLAEQRRFINDLDGFLTIIDELAPLCRTPDRRLGIAPHSLRAVGPADLRAVVAALDERDLTAPIHVHVAEQRAEVEASLATSGMRPVEWLVEHVPLSSRWCLVHATHLDDAEIASATATGAIAGLCPTTEGNLGDGIFRLGAWLASGGAIAIGSDSHVSVDPAQELRWLEYTQRLREHRRTVTESPEALYAMTARAGARALGRPVGIIAAGMRADFVVLDAEQFADWGGDIATALDRSIICGGPRTIREVYTGGVRVVSDRRHHRREQTAHAFRRAIERLR